MTLYGWIGTGNLGGALVLRLAETQDVPILAYNRTASKVPKHKNITTAASSAEIAQKCDIIFTSLNGDSIVQNIYENEIFPNIKGRDVTLVETSTIMPELAKTLSEQAKKLGAKYSQAPVFGPPPAATKGEMIISVSGTDQETVDKIAQITDGTIARKAIKLVPDKRSAERSAALKLAGNSMLIGFIEVIAEAITFAEATGLGTEVLSEFVAEMYPLPLFKFYGKRMCNSEYKDNIAITVNGIMKDANHIRDTAVNCNSTMPVIDVARTHLVGSRALGGTDYDWSSLIRTLRNLSGLPLDPKSSDNSPSTSK